MPTPYAPSPPHSGRSPSHSSAFDEENDDTITSNPATGASLFMQHDNPAAVTSEINDAPDRTREYQRNIEHLRRDSEDEESDFESDQDEDEEEIVNDDYDDEAAREFAVAKAAYEDKKRGGFTDAYDDVIFTALKNEEAARQEKKKREVLLDNPYSSDEDDQDSDDDMAHVPEKAPKKRGRPQKDQSTPASKKAKTKDIRQYLDKAQGTKGKSKRTKTTVPSMMRSALGSNIFKDAARAADYAAPASHAAASNRTPAATVTAMLAGMQKNQKREARERWNTAIGYFTGRVVSKHADGHHFNVSGINTPLEPYQIEGVGMMRGFELGEIKGGILADAMGLGKTLETICNIINGRQQQRKGKPRATLIVLPRNLVVQWYEEIKKHAMTKSEHARWGYSSIVRHYARERVDEANALKTFQQADFVITTYDEVMKSYPKASPPVELAGDPEARNSWWNEYYHENKGLLHQVSWYRVVLDEAQAIKGHGSRRSQACRALEAEYRWAVTGTPIMNDFEEFYPYFKFLRLPWITDLRQFRANFCTPGSSDGQERLEAILGTCMIRRTHADMQFGKKLLDLPQPTNEAVAIDFNIFERQVYKILENRASLKVNKARKKDEIDDKNTAGTTALAMISVLRQATCHPLLIPLVASDLLEREDYEKLKKIAENERDLDLQQKAILADMLHTLKRTTDVETTVTTPSAGRAHGTTYRVGEYLTDMESLDGFQKMNNRVLCCVCASAPQQPHQTDCNHFYCAKCLEDILDAAAYRGQDQTRCSECGGFFSSSKPFDLSTTSTTEGVADDSSLPLLPKKKKKKKKEQDWIDKDGLIPPSAKTMAVKAQIVNWQQEDPTAKVIIFTQWVPMIRILAKVCQEEGWGYCTLQGEMTMPARDTALKEFNSDPTKKIFISTLKCGGEGLNLNMASRVISLDPWFNESVEHQAFGRVYRIGQDKETFMTKFYIRGTIDERMLALQKTKQAVINAIMDDSRKKESPPLEDLLALFGPLDGDDESTAFMMPSAEQVHDGSVQFADAEEEARSRKYGN